MRTILQPWQILAAAMAGWIARRQDAAVKYLREENWVLKEQLGRKRLRLTDAHRRRLAVRASALGHRELAEVASIVTPTRSFGGIGGWSRKSGRTRCGRRVDQVSWPRSRNS